MSARTQKRPSSYAGMIAFMLAEMAYELADAIDNRRTSTAADLAAVMYTTAQYDAAAKALVLDALALVGLPMSALTLIMEGCE